VLTHPLMLRLWGVLEVQWAFYGFYHNR